MLLVGISRVKSFSSVKTTLFTSSEENRSNSFRARVFLLALTWSVFLLVLKRLKDLNFRSCFMMRRTPDRFIPMCLAAFLCDRCVPGLSSWEAITSSQASMFSGVLTVFGLPLPVFRSDEPVWIIFLINLSIDVWHHFFPGNSLTSVYHASPTLRIVI